MTIRLTSWRWRLCLGFWIFDLLWSASALKQGSPGPESSTVQMGGLVVWIFLHLPAVLLASWPFEGAASVDTPLPTVAFLLMAFFGALQSSLLGFLLGRFLDRRHRNLSA